MNPIRFWLALLMLSATLCQCRKTKAITPEDYLPPETQFGAGTFACRINGKVWTYKDHNGGPFDLRPVTSWQFEPFEYNGVLAIDGLNYTNNDQLGLRVDSLNISKTIMLDSLSNHLEIRYYNYSNKNPYKCESYFTKPYIDKTPNFYRQGKLEVTRLDTQARIIAGRFNCTIYQTGCDTLKITDGRFDLKYNRL